METMQRMRTKGSNPRWRTKQRISYSEELMNTINLTGKVQNATPYWLSPNIMIMQNSSQAAHNNKSKAKNELKFESPRLELDDSQLFPHASNAEVLANPDERWQAVKEQAGSHQQDGSVLRLRPNIDTPKVLQYGMPSQAAARVRELHVQVTGETLPSWMDAIAGTFHNLQHLYISQISDGEKSQAVKQSVAQTRVETWASSRKKDRSSPSRLRLRRTQHQKEEQGEEEYDEAEKAAQHSDRLKRLYILYRLPSLVSINGLPVSSAELKLARPDDPNGERVKRYEWVHDENVDMLNLTGVRVSEESAELDSLHPIGVGYPERRTGMQRPLTHREKSVEVDLTGNLVEEEDLALDLRLPRRQSKNTGERNSSARDLGKQEKKHESFMGDVLHCGELVLSQSTSVITDDCHWTAACGLPMPLFRKSPENTKAFDRGRVKDNLRHSHSWKDCRTTAPPLTKALVTKATTKSSPKHMALPSPWRPRTAGIRLTARNILVSTAADEVDPARFKPLYTPGTHAKSGEESDTITPRENYAIRGKSPARLHRRGLGSPARHRSPSPSPTTSRGLGSPARYRSPSPSPTTARGLGSSARHRSPSPSPAISTTSIKHRLRASLSADSPSPMQRRQRNATPTARAGECAITTLKVDTTQDLENTTILTTPPPVPPPAPNSGRSVLSYTLSTVTGVSNVATIGSAFMEGSKTPSPAEARGQKTYFATDTEKKTGLPPPAPQTTTTTRFRMKVQSSRRKKMKGFAIDRWKESLLSDEEDNSDCDAYSCTGSEGEIEVDFQNKSNMILAKKTM